MTISFPIASGPYLTPGVLLFYLVLLATPVLILYCLIISIVAMFRRSFFRAFIALFIVAALIAAVFIPWHDDVQTLLARWAVCYCFAGIAALYGRRRKLKQNEGNNRNS